MEFMNPAVKKYIQFDGLLLSILWLLLVFSHCDKMFGFLNHSHILWMHMKGTESMFSFFFPSSLLHEFIRNLYQTNDCHCLG